MYDRNRYLSATLEVHFSNSNTTIMAYVIDPNSHVDYSGAVYYVVVVVLIYALSIVMMIASHIRKNQQDSQLRTYLKEMAVLRKNDKREKIMCRVGNLATKPAQSAADQPVKTPPANSAPPETAALIPCDIFFQTVPANDANPHGENSKKARAVTGNSPKRSYLPNIVIQVIDENTPL